MPERLPNRDDILELLSGSDRPMHAREIAAKLRVPEVDYLGFQRVLDDLSFQGVLSVRPGERFRISEKAQADKRGAARGEEREGILTVNARGFGFVAALGKVGDDVFVQADKLGAAMHGDRVVVQVIARGSRGAEGEIVRVVDRGIKRIAGTLHRRARSAWLEPDDTRIRGPITLPDDIDARGPEGNSGTEGDAVIVTITRYPEFPGETPVGKIEAVLGRPGELAVEVQKILLLQKIEELHSEQAAQEASSYGAEVPLDMLEGREDLRHLPLPTIDPEDARDHDDAVWVERNGDGGYTAWVAIADVSTYVVLGTKLDEEAKLRGCSVYLPDRAIPMLPRALSSNLCSLLPDVDRLCLCVEMQIDGGGNVRDTRIIRGIMKSRAKLTYGGVARALGFTENPPRQPDADAMKAELHVAYELSRLLRGKRMKRGALDFDLPEAKIILDEQRAAPTDIQRRASDPGMKKAYQLIEELMILANEKVAEWMVGRGLPTIFRVHAAPDEQKLDRFSSMCEQLGIPFDPEDTKDPKRLSQLLKSFAEHPLAPVLNSLLLRSMKQATYDVTNVGHFGLASKAYLHFTSPIRRYPDLVVHRAVHDAILGRALKVDAREKMIEAAQAASMAERRAMEVERAVVDLYRAFLMKERIGERYEGTVTAVVGSGAFVSLDAPFVDVLVRTEDMGADRYEIDDEGLRVVGVRSGDVISLGDRMAVQIIDTSILRRSVYGKRLHAEGSGEDRRAKPGKGAKKTFEAPKRVDQRIERAARNHKKMQTRAATQKQSKGGGGGGPKRVGKKAGKKRR